MFDRKKKLPTDMIEECRRRYSSSSRMNVDECLGTYEKTHDYRELLYAVHALVNTEPFVQDIDHVLKRGAEYVERFLDDGDLCLWKKKSAKEYAEELRKLASQERIFERTKFVAYCLCGAWAAQHEHEAA